MRNIYYIIVETVEDTSKDTCFIICFFFPPKKCAFIFYNFVLHIVYFFLQLLTCIYKKRCVSCREPKNAASSVDHLKYPSLSIYELPK